jgi:hypothetical protein
LKCGAGLSYNGATHAVAYELKPRLRISNIDYEEYSLVELVLEQGLETRSSTTR